VTKIGKGDTDDDTEIHDVEIELYDAQAAAEKILRIHGKFTEKIDLSNTDGTLKPLPTNAEMRLAEIYEMLKQRAANDTK